MGYFYYIAITTDGQRFLVQFDGGSTAGITGYENMIIIFSIEAQ